MAHTLSAFLLFRGLGEAELTAIAEAAEAPVRYRKGEVIYRCDDFRRAIGLILEGSVTVRREALMMNRLCAGDMFGAAALFDESETYVTQITAEDECLILFLSQETMSRLLREYPPLAENYIRFLSGRIRFLNRKLAVLTEGSAEHRVYSYLLAHSDEQGLTSLPPSMVELAHTLNIGRSSLYRAVDALLKEGVIARDGRCYRLIK